MSTKLQHDLEKVIYNFSSYDLTQTEVSLFLKGLNFSLPPQRLKFGTHLLPFELLYIDVINDEKKDDDALIDLKSKNKRRWFIIFLGCTTKKTIALKI